MGVIFSASGTYALGLLLLVVASAAALALIVTRVRQSTSAPPRNTDLA